MLPNSTQTQTVGASIVAGLAGYAFGHGWLGLSLSDWTTIFGSAMAGGARVWPLAVTRMQDLKTTLGEHYGRIDAANLRRAHAALESHGARGKIVLEGF